VSAYLLQTAGEPSRKRKATSQQPPPGGPHQRLRSPPFVQQGGLGNPPRGLRRSHQRQQSDLSSYSSFRRSQQENLTSRGPSPAQFSTGGGSIREGGSGGGEGEQQSRGGGGHSVGSLLSNEPPRRGLAGRHRQKRRQGDHAEKRVGNRHYGALRQCNKSFGPEFGGG
jgi:hypothetical protein